MPNGLALEQMQVLAEEVMPALPRSAHDRAAAIE
jgi:hypothetical protein